MPVIPDSDLLQKRGPGIVQASMARREQITDAIRKYVGKDGVADWAPSKIEEMLIAELAIAQCLSGDALRQVQELRQALIREPVKPLDDEHQELRS